MIQVTFDAVGPGTCGWCRKAKDVIYTVTFSDKSFVGPMCKADLLRAVEMKVPVHNESKSGIPSAQPAKPNGSPVSTPAK